MKEKQHDSINILLAQQQRYKKMIKSYQENDLSKEYNQLKQTKEVLIDRLNAQTEELTNLKKQLIDNEQQLQQLKKENKALRAEIDDISDDKQPITNQIEQLIMEELERHFFLIYHLMHLLFSLDKNLASKEVFDSMETPDTGTLKHVQQETEKKISQENLLTTLQHVKEQKQPLTPATDVNKPKPFNFKDLQSYQSAYLLPNNNQGEKANANTKHTFHKKTKMIQKIKQNQLQKASSLEPKIELNKNTEFENDKMNEDEIMESLENVIAPQQTDITNSEIVEETFDTPSETPIQEEKTVFQQLWDKIKLS